MTHIVQFKSLQQYLVNGDEVEPMDTLFSRTIQFANDNFEFDSNEYRLVYQQVDIDKLKLIHSTVYHDRKGRYWIDPNNELFDLRKIQWYQQSTSQYIEVPQLLLKDPMVKRPMNQIPEDQDAAPI